MKILIVNKSDLSIASRYEDDAPAQHKFGGPWGNQDQSIHIECPAQLDAQCVKVIDNEGVLEVQEDAILLAAKVEQQWTALRNERNQKLANCDWTQLSDCPLNAQDKAAWGVYRQALRDLPENTLNPATPIWPNEPDVQI